MSIKSIKVIFCFLCLFLLISEALTIFGQSRNKIKTISKIAKKLKAEDVRRKEVETLLLRGEYQHDGSGELIYIGTFLSVPALLKVLENNPPQIFNPCDWASVIESPLAPVNNPLPPPQLNNTPLSLPVPYSPPKVEEPKQDCSPHKSYICTYAHAVTALRKIPGQNFVDYQDWKNWWEKYQTETKSPKIK